MADRNLKGSGTGELMDELKAMTEAMKQTASTMDSFHDQEIEFKTKGADKVVRDAKNVSEALDEATESSRKVPKPIISDQILGKGNVIQQRITKIKAQMDDLRKSVTNADGSWSGKILDESSVERYLALYRELQKYAEIGATRKDSRFVEMFNNIKNLAPEKMFPKGLKQYFESASDGEADYQYKKAMKAATTEYNKGVREQEKSALDGLSSTLDTLRESYERLNGVQAETSQSVSESGNAAETATDQYMKLSEAYQQLSEIEQRIREFGKSIQELRNTGVGDPNLLFDDEVLDEEQYRAEIERITSMLEEVNKMKTQLSGMAINPEAEQAVERRGIGYSNLDDLKSQLEERKRIVEEYLQSDAFDEQRITQKQEELRQRITSHRDWYDYGEGTWIDEYVTKIREGTRTVDEAYDELINKLQANKLRIQEEQQRERDYETFDDFLREKALGDYDTYHEYLEKYEEIANEIREGTTSVARAMIDVGAEIDEALRQSVGSSGGQDFTKPLIEQLETLEELKERAARLGSKGRIIDEEDMHDRIYSNMPGNGWDPDIYDYDGLEQYKQLLERLIELRDRALTSAREQQRAYIDWGDQSDYDEMNQFLERYNEYIAAINYMQERIEEMQNEKIQGFESSGEWDADSINWLVETLKTLAEEIRNVSQAFGRIDDESGIPTLLSQLQSLTTAITTAFNTDNIELFKQALSDVNSTLSAISSSIGPIGGGRSKESQEDMLSMRDRLRNIQYKTGATELNIDVVEGASEAEQKVKETLEKQRERYMKAYERMVEIARNIYGDTDPEGMMLAELENVPAISNRLSYAGQSANKLFGSAVITQMGDSEEAVRRLQMFVSYMKEALSYYQDLSDAFRAAQKNGETLYGIPTDPMTGFWEQVQKPLKSVSGDTKVMRQRTSKIFEENAGSKRTLQDIIAEALGIKSEGEETVLTQYQQNVEQLMTTLTQFQDVLSKGFGIQEKDGAITSYLSELITKMKEVATAAQNMAEAIQTAFNPEKDTTGLQGQIQEDINKSTYTVKVGLDPSSSLQSDIEGKIQEGGPYKVNVQINKGEISTTAQQTKEEFQSAVGSIDVRGISKSLSDEFGINSHNSRLRGEVISLVQEITDTLNKAFDGSTFNIQKMGDELEDLSQRLASIFRDNMYNEEASRPDIEGWREFYEMYKDYKFLITEDTKKGFGAFWEDDLKGSRNLSEKAGLDFGRYWDEMYSTFPRVFDNIDAQYGMGLDTQYDQIMAFVYAMREAKKVMAEKPINYEFIDLHALDELETEAKSRVAEIVEEIKSKMAEGYTVKPEVKDQNSEVTMMEQLEQAVDLVTTAVLQKNDAFSVEATTVEQAIKRETSALDELANKIRKIAESLGKGDSFANFLTQIAENKESLVAFAEVLKKTQEEQKNAIDSANALAQAQQQADDAVEDSSGRWARRKYWLDANGEELSKAEVSKQKYANKHVTTTYRSSRAKDEEGNLTDEWELNGIEVENNYEAAAKAAEKAEADKQKAVEKTNTFIIEQSSALERLKEKYIENSKVTIDQKDLDELATLKQQIDDALTELNSDNFTQSNATQIKQWIKDYQQKAQLAIARQQVSQELQAYSPEAARQRQETRLNDLMRQIQTSGADTTDLERRLNELMMTFRNAPELTREFFTDIRNQYNILKDEFKDTDSVFKFNQSNIDKASTALENYEKAVNAVVKAKADLDFAKNKDDPVLVQNLEKAIEKAEEAKSKFIELKQFVFDYSNAGLTTQDFKDNMVGRANDANALLSDPTQGAYYQSKNMAQQQAENTAQLERQLDIIKQLAAARSLYNKIIAEDIAGKPSATDAEREALNQLIDEVKGKAEEAAEAINKMIQSGAVKLDDTGLKQFQELLDAMRYGDKSSIKLIDDAVLQRDVQTINEAQKAIQDYAKSVEKVNELQSKLTMGEGGKGIVDQITKATKEMNDLKKSADDAMDTLDRMNKDGFSQILSSKGFEDTQRAFKEANEMRDNIVNQSGNFGLENANRAYTTLIANAERYAQIIEKRASGKALSYNEVSFLSRLEQYYQDAANSAGIFANATDEVSQKLREQFNQAMNSADVNVVSRSYEQIGETLAKIGEGSWTEEGIKKLDELRAKYDQLTQSIGQIGTATKEQREAIRQSLREMATQMQGFLGNEKSNYLMADSRDVAVVNRQMSEWMTKNTLAEQYFPQIQELQQRLNGISAGGLTDVKAEFENIKREAIEAGKVGQTFGDALKKSFGGLARYMMTYASFYRIISVIRKAVNEVKELDSALMEVRKVSSETLSTLKQWQKLSFKQADEVGGSAVQIEKSTAAWLRLGKSFEEAQEAAQASVKLLNVSEFTNIDDATTSLVSMRQAFQDLTYEDFIDKLNGVGDNFSSSTDQLAQGMKNVSSVLKVAGNDIDQSLALLTAAIQLAVSYGNIIQRTYLIALIA